jgi:hypothetical protein
MSTVASPFVEVALRIVWGSYSPQSMEGTLELDQGGITVLRPLGMRSESPGCVVPEGTSRLRLRSLGASSFEGAEFLVRAPATAKLMFRTTKDPGAGSPANSTHAWTIQSLLGQGISIQFGNQQQLSLQRAPGDKLRFLTARSSMVFGPSEPMLAFIQAFGTGLPAGAYRLTWEWFDGQGATTRQSDSLDLAIDAEGNSPKVSLNSLSVPKSEGAFTLKLRLEPKRRLSTLVSASAHLERAIQVLVLEPQSPTPTDQRPTDQRPTDQRPTDTSPSTQDLWRPVPQRPTAEHPWWTSIPGLQRWSTKSATQDQDHVEGLADLDLSRGIEVPAKSYRVIPLTVGEAGRAHRIKLQLQSQAAAQLVLSVIDWQADGQPDSLRWDCATSAQGSFASTHIGPTSQSDAQVQDGVTHLFWPKTDQPCLVLYNPSSQTPFVARELVVEETTTGSLAANPSAVVLGTRSVPFARSTNADQRPRLVALQMDKPWLAEVFGAPLAFDVQSRQAYHDWAGLHRAAVRLAQYCRYAGYNGALVQVATEGGTLFPSEHLPGTPRFDTGVFFQDGRDPFQKDIVEMLMRIFDREDLQLVVGLDLSSPILALESMSLTNPEMSLRQKCASVPSDHPRARRASYAPSSPVFQNWMTRLHEELLQRYGHHRCWSGIALQLHPKSHCVWAGGQWGFDELMLASYAEEASGKLPSAPAELEAWLLGPGRAHWLQWRAQRWNGWMGTLVDRMRKAYPQLQYWLLTAGLWEESVREVTALTTQDESGQPILSTELSLLPYGVDLRAMGKVEGMQILRGEMDMPLEPLTQRKASLDATNDPQWIELFQELPRSGAQWLQRPSQYRIDGVRLPHHPESVRPITFNPNHRGLGIEARRPLAERWGDDDCLTWTEGSWFPVGGSEETLAPFRRLWASLPPWKLTSVMAAGEHDHGSVVVRTGQTPNESYLVLINRGPWQESVRMQWTGGFTHAESLHAESLHAQPLHAQPLHARTSVGSVDGLPRSLTMEPYSVFAWRLHQTQGTWQLVQWSHRCVQDVSGLLQKRLNDLAQSASPVAQQDTAPWISNGGFETVSTGRQFPDGWASSLIPTAQVQVVDDRHRRGKRCIRVEHEGGNATAWIQTDPLPLPQTDRVALEFFVQTEPQRAVPTLQATLTGYGRGGKQMQVTKPIQINPTPQGASTWMPCVTPLLESPLPPDIQYLRLSIDIAGAGTVLIDDVQLFDLYLDDQERRTIRAQLFLAQQELQEGNYFYCQRFLESYWALYLQQFVRPSVPPSADKAAEKGKVSNESPEGPQSGRPVKTSATTQPQEPRPTGTTEPDAKSDRKWLQRWRESWRRDRK